MARRSVSTKRRPFPFAIALYAFDKAKRHAIVVDGYHSDTPGLVVHRDLIDATGRTGRKWQVTNWFGVRIGGIFDTRAQALEFCAQLKGKHDWHELHRMTDELAEEIGLAKIETSITGRVAGILTINALLGEFSLPRKRRAS